MKLKFILLLSIVCICASIVYAAGDALPAAAASSQAIGTLEPFQKNDRVLIFAPHPDDEAIGCAGAIQQALAVGAKVKVAYLTNGDHNQLAFIVYEKRLTVRKGEFIHMGEVRRKEAIKAMKLLGLHESDLVFMGYPDFGTLAIFASYWQTPKPFKDLMTRISAVPYKTNLSYGAPYVGESILSDYKKILLDFKPTKILVSHPSDVNRDHKACYLFLQVALADLGSAIPAPRVYPYLVHRVAWPLPRHYHPDLPLMPPPEFMNGQFTWLKLALTKSQIDKKYQAILCYGSQTRVSAFYLLAFARSNELFDICTDIGLLSQVSLKEQAVQFFGFSKMYRDSELGTLNNANGPVENERVGYAVVDNDLLIHIEKDSEINRRLQLQVQLYGYSSTTPFAQMPKIRILTRYTTAKIFDKKKLLKDAGVTLTVNTHSADLRLPLALLGNPDFILASMRAYHEALPADATGFKKITITQGGPDAGTKSSPH